MKGFLAMILFSAGIAAQTPVIIDTDAGSDDLMAIAFLLARQDVKIEAITIVDGLAHVPAGAANVLRLLQLAGASGVPVYPGSEEPLERTAPFPADWRRTSDTLPGVKLPAPKQKPEHRHAADFLVARLGDSSRPVSILALGPLSNLGDAFRRAPQCARAVSELVIMGGAVRVNGNLGDGGFFKTTNTSAEWNLFHDPLAAEIVFHSGVRIRMIPLDATNQVPIDAAFLQELSQAHTPLAQLVAQILETERSLVEQKIFFAWDPLAAVALVDPAVVTTSRMAIEILRKPPEQGRTKEVNGHPPNTTVALDANPAEFKRAFLRALGHN
jgi:purine nucleosidase/pyrimidine-specific ribonucleoside hydrolase